MRRNLDSLAAEYLRVGRALRDDASQKDRDWYQVRGLRPSQQLEQLMWTDPEEMWRLILALVNRATANEDLAFVAAGPIEDFLSGNGSEFAGRISAEAGANPRLAQALNYAWGWHVLPEDVQAALLPLLDPEVRTYWLAEKAAAARGREAWDRELRNRPAKTRFRPPPGRPKS